MRGIQFLMSAAVLFTALNTSRGADDEKYDLRGPARKEKQTLIGTSKMTIKDADMTITLMGMKVPMKVDMVMDGEEEATVLAMDGRNVTKCKTKITKEQVTVSPTVDGKKVETETEKGELEGEIVYSERDGKKWKHSLLDTKPTEKQEKQLEHRNGIVNEDDLYPEEKVAVGHKWTVDAAALNKIFGNSFTEVKGKVNQKFTKIDEIGGEKVAVIESTGKVTAKMKEGGDPALDVEMEMKVTSWRSVKTGITVKEKFEGKIKMSGPVDIEGMKVDMTLDGPISGESTTKMVEKKGKE